VAPRVAVLKYGVGNIYSIVSGLRRAGAEPVVVDCLRSPGGWDGVVLPGVGAYEAASRRLHRCVWEIRDALSMGAQLLGVCLGLQLVFEESREAGLHSYGLGLLPGRVEKLTAPKLPHIGWSRVWRVPGRSCRLLEGVDDGGFFYYVHSYAYMGVDEPWVCAWSSYGLSRFAAVVEAPPVYATQFHPERSSRLGEAVLRNWVGLLRR
jgi:glutamine amidotransferase